MKKAKVNSVYGGRGRKRSKARVEESGNSSKSASMTENGRKNGVRATKALSTIPNNRTIVTRSMAMKTMELEDEEMLYEVEIIEIREEEKNDDNKPMELVQQQEKEQEPQEPQEQEPQEPQEQEPQEPREPQEQELQEPQEPQEQELQELQEPQEQEPQEQEPQEQEPQEQEQQPEPEPEPHPQPQPPANEVAGVENKGDEVAELTLDDWPVTCRFDDEWPWVKAGYDSGWYSCWETMNGGFWTPMKDDSQESVWSGDLWEFKP